MMLEKLLLEFVKRINIVYTLGNKSPNWVTKVDSNGIYIETESSRTKYRNGTEKEPGTYFPINLFIESWNLLKQKRKVTADDLIHLGHRSSFLLGFYSQLPFVEVLSERPAEIALKEYTTNQLPEASLKQTLDFLREIKDGKYHPQQINSQIAEDSLKRLKSRSRQGLKLLGFLKSDFSLDTESIEAFNTTIQKEPFLRSQVLKHDYFQILYECLTVMKAIAKKDKLQSLTELGMLIVRNSMGDNLMKESVAEYRTRNILQWFEEVGLVDEEWNPVQKDMTTLKEEFKKFKEDEYHQFYINLRKRRGEEIRNWLSSTNTVSVDEFNREVWNIGYAYDGDKRFDVFKLMTNPNDVLLSQLSTLLERNELDYKGNACWGSGSKIYGYSLSISDEDRENYIKKVIQILNNQGIKPEEKAIAIKDIPGFGLNSATGLVMLFHPKEFAIYNKPSQTALKSLGYEADSFKVFQRDIHLLKEQLGAEDYIELDWFLYVYNLNGETIVSNKKVNYWWVNQGQTHESEKEGGFLWAPKQVKNGASLSHHIDLQKAEPGDIVFAYSSKKIKAICIVREVAIDSEKPNSIASGDWQTEGLLLKAVYYPLTTFINKDDIPLQWRIDEAGPFDRNGDLKQGYFFSLSNPFAHRLLQKFASQLPERIRTHLKGQENQGNPEVESVEETHFKSDQELVNHIHNYISAKGFFYDNKELMNFYLSVKTKPFVILSGISGTGKTKIVQYFAESIGATDKNKQFKLIPVRPDWSDGSDLLGYKDIKGDFIKGPLTEVLMDASQPENQDKPYFVLLDEMNLARVEYYFSDLLSVMESRKWDDGKMVTTPVLEDSSFDTPLIIPDNVYFVGTVNMDETTHPFSKKVLDRANTIEFNEVKLDYFDFGQFLDEIKSVNVSNDHFKANYLTLKDAYQENEKLIQDVSKQLTKINEILKINHAHIGYRVRDEICFYMIYNKNMRLLSQEEAFDYQLHQKILPRLAGSDARTDRVLKQLFTFCTKLQLEDDQIDALTDENFNQAKYPKSARKLAYMIRRQQDDGFTSFWIGS